MQVYALTLLLDLTKQATQLEAKHELTIQSLLRRTEVFEELETYQNISMILNSTQERMTETVPSCSPTVQNLSEKESVSVPSSVLHPTNYPDASTARIINRNKSAGAECSYPTRKNMAFEFEASME